jgi:hypothetical protein
MKIIQKSQSKKRLIITVLILILVGMVVSCIFLFFPKQKSDMPLDSNSNNVNQTSSQSDSKQDAVKTDNSSTKTPLPEDNNLILEAHKETDGSMTVITKLKNVSDGTCQLTVTGQLGTTVYNAPVIFQPEYSSCEGFSVPIAQGDSGSWKISLKVTSNGTSATKTISVDS